MRSILPLRAAAAALLLGIAPAAHGAVLATPPAVAHDLGGTLFCQVRNVAPTPTKVTTQVIGFTGAAMASGTMTLAPGQATTQLAASGFAASCRFEVAGSAKKVRAVALYSDGDEYTAGLPAR